MRNLAVLLLCFSVACGGNDSKSESTTDRRSTESNLQKNKKRLSQSGDQRKSSRSNGQDECPKKQEDDAPNLHLMAAAVETQPTYEGTIKSLVNSKCVWCHSATADIKVRAQPYLTSFALVTQNAARSKELMAPNSPQPMPPAGGNIQLTETERKDFDAWIAGGTPQGSAAVPVDPARAISYVDPIKRILDASCVGCHKPGLTPPDLSTYASASAAARTSWVTIQAQSMPPAVPLPADQAVAFKAWLDAGAPESVTTSTSTATSTTTSKSTSTTTGTSTSTQESDELEADESESCD